MVRECKDICHNYKSPRGKRTYNFSKWCKNCSEFFLHVNIINNRCMCCASPVRSGHRQYKYKVEHKRI